MNRIIHGDARNMAEVANASVQLVVTSPPYNVGMNYDVHDDNMTSGEWRHMLKGVIKECHRVLVPGGRLCINVANTGRAPYVPLHFIIGGIIEQASESWLMRGEIIWDRGASAGVSTAWGSFGRASNPVLRDVHEYILVYSKDQYDMSGRETGITAGQFVGWTRSIWRPEERVGAVQKKAAQKIRYGRQHGKSDEWIAEQIARAADSVYAEAGDSVWLMNTANDRSHPAPFPVELPRRLVLLYSEPGGVVLDPFMGTGSTGIAALREGRQFVGYDVSAEYCRLAADRLEKCVTLFS